MNFLHSAMLTDAVGETAASTEDISNLMNSTLTFGERIAKGLQVMLFGMAVVFSVLILIWIVLVLFKIIFYDIPNKKKAAAAPAVKAPETAPAPEPAPVAEAVESADEPDEAELVAAITAAIAVVMDKPQTSFRVVSFRRTASK